LTNNFSSCYEDLPVVFDYFNHKLTALLTTDLILRPTSRRIDYKDIKSRYFFLPTTNLLLHQVGSVLTFGRHDDVLWQSLDTSNIMLSQANSIKHYHGTLDGLDVLSMIPEYTQFDEMGVSFNALDKESDPMTPQAWWSINKWYFYGTALCIIGLVSICGLACLFSCSNGCLFNFCFTPCVVIRGQCHKRHIKQKMVKELTELTSHEIQPLSNSLLLQPPLTVTTGQSAVHFETSTATTSKATPTFAVRYVPVTKKQ
jgi:hypothetical protein